MPYNLVPVNYDPFALVRPTQQGTYAPVNPAADQARAIQELKTYTGITDLQAAIAAAQRGEATQAIGQGTLGLLGALGVIQPAARGPAAAIKALESAPVRNALGQAAKEVNALLPDVNRVDNALMPIRAYHGSPHDFDAFDLSKIGTGEGAQAYGHGLYLAENEGVARSYREALTAQQNAIGPKVDNAYIEAAKSFIDAGHTPKDTLAGLQRAYKNAPVEILEAALRNAKTDGKGRMYEVNIHADPDTFLLWDKPLSEQPEKVRQALLADPRVAQSIEKQAAILGDKARDPSGQAAYAMMTGWRRGVDLSPPGEASVAASEALRNSGVSGIKYFDQGSRTAGSRTSNYVVFDDKMIEILRKYGLLGLLGGGAATLSDSAQAQPYPHPTDEYIDPPPKKP